MSSGKRPASGSFGSSQMVVKRQNTGNDSTALATTNGSTGNGALIQAVCICPYLWNYLSFKERLADSGEIGTSDKRFTSSSNAIGRALGRGICCQIRPKWKLYCLRVNG